MGFENDGENAVYSRRGGGGGEGGNHGGSCGMGGREMYKLRTMWFRSYGRAEYLSVKVIGPMLRAMCCVFGCCSCAEYCS